MIRHRLVAALLPLALGLSASLASAADPNPQNGGVPYLPNANPVNCVGVVPRGSRPGQFNEGPNAGLNKSSATKLTTPLDPLVCVLAFKFIHSGTAPVDPSFPHATL